VSLSRAGSALLCQSFEVAAKKIAEYHREFGYISIHYSTQIYFIEDRLLAKKENRGSDLYPLFSFLAKSLSSDRQNDVTISRHFAST